MPELPEVETICRALSDNISGAVINKVELRRKNLRVDFPENFAKNLAGRQIKEISRRAKYLIFALDNGKSIIAHLGMSGSFTVKNHDKAEKLGKHDHVVFTFSDGRILVYNDPRRFGLMILADSKNIEQHKLFSNLGPEPFSNDFSIDYLQKMLSVRKIPIKPAIMEQKLVVGVGNIYASEALFLAGIDPRKSSLEVAKNEQYIKDIVKRIREVLKAAIESGGSSLRDFVHISGETGSFQHNFNVYGRSGKLCICCKDTIKTIRQAGRATFFCPTCQK